MRVFVTGGTGLLGNTILRQLDDAGAETVALVRDEPDSQVFTGIEPQFAHGDVSDVQVIDDAIANCDAVVHSAGLIHIGWTRLGESMRVNRDGTQAIVDACIRHGTRLVHVGTVDTLAPGTPDQPADETTPLDNAGGKVPCSYVVSKQAGVEVVTEGVHQGLNAVIVHPGFMLGPWDWKPSSGRMMLEVGKSWKPIAPAGGCSLCDSRDVAAAAIRAIDADVDRGRQFILAGHNISYRDLWTEMAARMGMRPPIMTLGPIIQRLAGDAGDLWAKVGTEGDLNSAGVRMSAIFHYYDSGRAKAELGYEIRPASESLDAAAKWIRQHHLPK